MSLEVWPTPEQVEARIAEVAALNRLCASLAEAGKALREPPPKRPPER
jgi:hypothetical protein